MEIDAYFQELKEKVDHVLSKASICRKKGLDPSNEVEIKIAKDVAARVEGIVGPKGIAEEIRKMEKMGMSREEIAFDITKKIAGGELFSGPVEKRIEQSIRTGVALLTEGVLVAPTEGISKVKLKKNPDGTDYLAIYYAGPIRSAGGTAAALSVVLADIARRSAGISEYIPTDSQVERYVEEVNIYESRVSHLQYKPSDDDIRHIVKNCPVCIDGDPTAQVEVSVYKDIPGVETNRIRGGVPLVICEGIAQKAAKVLKYTKKINLDWDWLEKIIKIKKKAAKLEIKPDFGYLDGKVAGRPIFSEPSKIGGFRLRYGRTRTNGIMAKTIHSATMILLDGFLAYGTHMKVERPGKGCVVTGAESIEPPVVRLNNGDVVRVKTTEEAKRIQAKVEKILFLGDFVSTYGDFSKSNHPLLPSPFVKEWWLLLAKEKGVSREPSSPKEAFEISMEYSLPLHPDFLFFWDHITDTSKIQELAVSFSKGIWSENEVRLPYSKEIKEILETILCEHRIRENWIILRPSDAETIARTFGMWGKEKLSADKPPLPPKEGEGTLEYLSRLSGVEIKAKGRTYIGAKMGRPEKAMERKMKGDPVVLFPTSSTKIRDIIIMYEKLRSKGKSMIKVELVRYKCKECSKINFTRKCQFCGGNCTPERICPKCNAVVDSEEHCGSKTKFYNERGIDLVDLINKTKQKLGFLPKSMRGVGGLSNAMRIPEIIEKGFIRAKHSVYVFRDGTSRFDASDVPLTHFIPKEIGLSIEKAKELGYTKDYLGKDLVSEDQLVPLKPQDIVLSERGAEYFVRVAKAIDDMLINIYGEPPFYKVEKKEDLIGHLGVGLAPHTSAGVLCRIIGWTKANVGYAHPYFHTAKRRNADGDEDSVMLLLDAFLNFSKHYLSESRGGTMDAPIVLTIRIDPKEVDDEVHEMEFQGYDLEFYESTERFASPGEIKIKTIKDVLGTPEQYNQIPLTIPEGTFLDKGPTTTKYKLLKTTMEKVEAEMKLHEKIMAVEARNAAKILLTSHLIPDIYGNLHKFSTQKFRCTNCNESFRRVPLSGKCTRCGGNLTLTVHKGGIIKYLDVALSLSEKYDLPLYLKQRLQLVKKEIKSIFEDEENRQLGLADFI